MFVITKICTYDKEIACTLIRGKPYCCLIRNFTKVGCVTAKKEILLLS